MVTCLVCFGLSLTITGPYLIPPVSDVSMTRVMYDADYTEGKIALAGQYGVEPFKTMANLGGVWYRIIVIPSGESYNGGLESIRYACHGDTLNTTDIVYARVIPGEFHPCYRLTPGVLWEDTIAKNKKGDLAQVWMRFPTQNTTGFLVMSPGCSPRSTAK